MRCCFPRLDGSILASGYCWLDDRSAGGPTQLAAGVGRSQGAAEDEFAKRAPECTGGRHQDSCDPPAPCNVGPTPGFLVGQVQIVTATAVGVSAGAACVDEFPVGPGATICWATRADTWVNVWTRITPEDIVDVEASANPDGSVTIASIDIDTVDSQGIVPTANRDALIVQLIKSGGTVTLLISSSTMVEQGSVSGASNVVHVGEHISFTGDASVQGPIVRASMHFESFPMVEHLDRWTSTELPPEMYQHLPREGGDREERVGIRDKPAEMPHLVRGSSPQAPTYTARARRTDPSGPVKSAHRR
jgi:hypothetical protein